MMEGSRILVVHDGTTLRKLVELAMRGTGCSIDHAANGSEALMLARTSPPHVILLESADVCRRLSDAIETASVPVVVMSADRNRELDDFRGFPAVVDFVPKSVTTTEIRARLASAMRGPAPVPRFRRAEGSSMTKVVTRPRTPIDIVAEGLSRVAGMPLPIGVDAILQRATQLCTPEWLAELGAALGARREEERPQPIANGELAKLPTAEVLRRLAAAEATGVLRVELAATICVFVRRGEVVMCTTTAFDTDTYARALPPGLIVRARRDQAAGKPALITLAEAGLVRASDVPAQLEASSAQLLGELLDARHGRFIWNAIALPDFVEAFGAPVDLRHDTITLAHGSVITEVHDERSAGLGLARGVVVIDQAGDGFADALRAHLGRRAVPVEVIELDPGGNLADQILTLHPRAVLLNTRMFTPQLVEHDLPKIRRDPSIKLAGVLDIADPIESAFALASGVHVVVAKPIHVIDLDRLLLTGTP